MLPEILLTLSIVFIAAGSFLSYGEGPALLITGAYIGVIAFSMAYGRGKG